MRLPVLIVVGAFASLICVLAPYLAANDLDLSSFSFFTLVQDAWEEFTLVSIPFLLLVGVALGILCPKHWVVLGLSTAFAFPIIAILEMFQDSTSHNLLPFEFALYLVFIAGPAVLGALLGFAIARRRGHAT